MVNIKRLVFVGFSVIAALGNANATAVIDGSIGTVYNVPGSISKRSIATGPASASQTLSEGGAISAGTVDAAGGVLRAYAKSPRPAATENLEQYIVARTSSTIYDSVRFAGTEPFSGALQITFIGNLATSNFVDFTNHMSSFAWGQVGYLVRDGVNVAGGATNIASDCQGSVEPDCYVANSTRMALQIPFTVTASLREVNFQVTLAAQSYLDSTADFGQSAYLRISGVPEGTTFSSGSGEFLSNPAQIPAVPEPAAFQLLLVGIALLSVVARSKLCRKS